MPFEINEKDKFNPRNDSLNESPQPLFRELPPAAPYPLECLGDVLYGAAVAMKEAIQAPDALYGQSLLAAAALAVQGYADISRDGNGYPLSLFFMTVAQSGERKTAVDKVSLLPHREMEKKLVADWELKRKFFETENEAWESARKAASYKGKGKDINKADFKQSILDLGPKPEPPLSQLILMEDATLEGLQKNLLGGRPTVGLFSDEGGLTMGGHSMNADNQLKTISGYSKMWDGDALSRTRAGDGSYKIYGKRLSLHLMLQPGVANQMTCNEQMRDQGFLSRCLLAFPESTAGSRLYKEGNLNKNMAIIRYYDLMKNILEKPLPILDGTSNELKPRKLKMSIEAKKIWVLFHDHIEENLASDKKFSNIRGFASKAAEQALRISGVLSLIEDFQVREVSRPNMESAIHLMEFYLSEALRLFETAALNPDMVLAQKLSNWLKEKGLIEVFATQVYNLGPKPIRDKTVAMRVLGILENHNHIRKVSGKKINGKFHKDVWEVLV